MIRNSHEVRFSDKKVKPSVHEFVVWSCAARSSRLLSQVVSLSPRQFYYYSQWIPYEVVRINESLRDGSEEKPRRKE